MSCPHTQVEIAEPPIDAMETTLFAVAFSSGERSLMKREEERGEDMFASPIRTT
jgi:hypothetical protein